MLRKNKKPDGSIQRIIVVISVIVTGTLSCSLSHAIGPYVAGNKSVLDSGTGLEWQKNDESTLRTWQNALAYCENLSLDDKSDWRLPNIRELKSLVDYNNYYPAVDSVISCQSSIYWSATTVANDAHPSAWTTFFGNGDDIWKVKTGSHSVRCVRTAP